MRLYRPLLPGLASWAILLAQAPTTPVVIPRGVVNAFTQQPAPTSVAGGSLIWIAGLNLGPPEGAQAAGSPLPTELGGVQVLVNGKPIPLISVTPGRIVAQVPLELADTSAGTVAQLVVASGQNRSRPARFFVRALEPGVRAANDQGFGEVAGKLDGSVLTIAATGLGDVDADVKSGEAGPADPLARPKATIRAFAGGIPAKVNATLSPDRPGEFDVEIEVPPGIQPGDVLHLSANGRAANLVTLGSINAPEMQYLKLPEGAELRAINGSDLRGLYVVGNDARDEQGCYPVYIFDFARKNAVAAEGCLTAANKNAISPVVAVPDGAALVAFEGPPEGDAPSPVSSKVRILNPALDRPLSVTLSNSASNLIGMNPEMAVAVMPGTPPSAIGIDVNTGETREITGVNIGGGGALPGGGGLPGAGQNLSVDLGDGLDNVLSARTALGRGRSAVLVGDDSDKPQRAKLAVLDQQNKVLETRDFPAGFVPLVGPKPPQAPGGAGGQLAVRYRVTINLDAQTAIFYVLSRKPDDSVQGLTAFNLSNTGGEKALPFPNRWYAASCTSNQPIYNLELARRLAVMVTNTPETEFKQECYALGYAVVDLATQKVDVLPLSGEGHVNVATVSDMNDFLIATNVGNQRQPADTLFVLDGVTATPLRLQPPAGVRSFAGLRAIPSMGLLVALGQQQIAGDQGILVFDLENNQTRELPVPDGFVSVAIVDIMTATRKIVARGIKTGNVGAQYLVYDLMTKDLDLVPNPEGVAWVGAVPAQPRPPGQPAQPATPTIYQDSNTKANSVAAVCFDADRKQTGVMMFRVP